MAKLSFAIIAILAVIYFFGDIVQVAKVEVEPRPSFPGRWVQAYNLIDDERSNEDNCLLVAAYMARYKDEFPALPTEGYDKFEERLGTVPRFTMEPGFVRVVTSEGTLEVTVKTCEEDVFALPVLGE